MPEETKLTKIGDVVEGEARGDILASPIEEEGSLQVWPSTQSAHFLTCITGDDDESIGRRFACRAAADVRIFDALNMQFPVEAWFAHRVALADKESGEIKESTRLVLVTPTGTTHSTCSASFANLWRAVLQEFGNGPWEPPLQITPYGVQSRNNQGKYLQFKVSRNPKNVTPEAPAPTQPKEKVRTKANPSGD